MASRHASKVLSVPATSTFNTLRKGSFTNLARFFGLTAGSSSGDGDPDQHSLTDEEDGQDEEDHEEGEDVDEESLLWDAQAALIAHQPSLAIQHYTTAALPPYCSASACLALGNLLTRGTGFTSSPPVSPLEQPSTLRKGKEKAMETDTISAPTSPIPPTFSRLLHTFFGGTSQIPSSPSMTSPPDVKYDAPGNNWAIRKEGKRAVRNVEGMGIAGGWLVLGLGWIVDGEMERYTESLKITKSIHNAAQIPIQVRRSEHRTRTYESDQSEEDEVIMIGTKGKTADIRHDPHGRSRVDISQLSSPVKSTEPSTFSSSNTDTLSDTHTGLTTESAILETPHPETREDHRYITSVKTLQTMYELLQPLLHLYRHGHIQSSDPIYLPPVMPAHLPKTLRPVGDLQKRRNAWALGGVVAERLLQIETLQRQAEDEIDLEADKEARDRGRLIAGIKNLASYVLGMTADRRVRDVYFRAIVNTGPCGLTAADDIVRQAAKRLDIIANTPSLPTTPTTPIDGYPFPKMTSLAYPTSNQPRTKSKSRAKSCAKSLHKSNLSSSNIPPEVSRRQSAASLSSLTGDTGIFPSPVKAPCSTISHGKGHGYSSSLHSDSPVKQSASAMDTLRQVSQASLSAGIVHRRNGSSGSVLSLMSPGGLSLKSTLSASSPMTDSTSAAPDFSCSPSRESAIQTLKRVRNSASDLCQVDEDSRWPNLAGWTMTTSPPTPGLLTSPSGIDEIHVSDVAPGQLTSDKHNETYEKKKMLRPIASSPNFQSTLAPNKPAHRQHRAVSSLISTPRSNASSASLLCPDMEIAAIDPKLAAAELASTLTKRVCCSVCAVKGVNFPECRKCGMRFCSRDCRVGLNGAGDGKKHLCGVWAQRTKRAAEAEAEETGSKQQADVPGINVSFAESLGKTPKATQGVRAF